MLLFELLIGVLHFIQLLKDPYSYTDETMQCKAEAIGLESEENDVTSNADTSSHLLIDSTSHLLYCTFVES